MNAIEKLNQEYKSGKYDRYAEAMKSAVLDALKDFASQDEEFARAIEQGGTFEKCMQAVTKNCGKSISDLEAYQKAVSFYFPGAKIKFNMSIDLIGDAAAPDLKQEKSGLILDLSAFL